MTRVVPEGWSAVSNDDVFTLVKGSVIKDISTDQMDGHIPYLLIETFDSAKPAYVPAEKAVACDSDDPVIVMDGSRSGLVLRGKAGALGSTLAAARPLSPSRVSKDFLFHYLASLYSLLNLGKTGGAVPHVDRQFLMSLSLLLPPLAEQKKIAEILGSIDTAIAATRRVIEQTRNLKRALMQELLTRGIPGRHTRFKDSPLGKIPADRKLVTIGEVLERIDAGKSPQCESRPAREDEWGVLKISAISWDHFDDSEHKALPASIAAWPEGEVRAGDLIISRANTSDLVGAAVRVLSTRPKLLLCDKTLRLIPKSSIEPGYLLLSLRTAPVREWFESEATGTSKSMKNISQDIIRAAPLSLPPVKEQTEILRIFASVDNNLASEGSYLAQLTRTKAGLLDLLLSGEIRVPVSASAKRLATA